MGTKEDKDTAAATVAEDPTTTTWATKEAMALALDIMEDPTTVWDIGMVKALAKDMVKAMAKDIMVKATAKDIMAKATAKAMVKVMVKVMVSTPTPLTDPEDTVV